MTDIPLHVAHFEHGILRIWGFDGASTAGLALIEAMEETPRDAGAAMEVLGAERVDPYWLDLVRMADIAEMGLAGYLQKAYEVPRDVAEGVAPAGDHVLIAPSRAFADHEQTLSPDPVLQPVAVLDIREDVGALRPMDTVETTRRATAPGETPEPEPGPPAGRGLRPGAIILLLLIAAAFIAMVAL
jgi:hypothetical protein